MMNKITLSNFPWKSVIDGLKEKNVVQGDIKVRLLSFSDDFHEEDWCTKGHIGYIIEGRMKINFNGRVVHYNQGDVLTIEKGEQDKHKVIIEKREEVKLIVFENLYD